MADQLTRTLLQHIPTLEIERPLRSLNPLGVGGVADFYTEAQDSVQVAAAVNAAITEHIPYIVLGRGSSSIPADGGFPGLVVMNTSHSFMLASEHSQVLVDSGISLDQLITQGASRSLGGLSHLFGMGGSLGGGLYHNTHLPTGPALQGYVRYVTVLQPPARIDREATVARFQANWLLSTDPQFPSKLAQLKQGQLLGASQAVLLTVVLQLTSLRQDEVQLQLKGKKTTAQQSSGWRLFDDPLDGFATADELLKKLQVSRRTYPGFSFLKDRPSIAVSTGKRCEAADVWATVMSLQQEVLDTYQILLPPAVGCIGAW